MFNYYFLTHFYVFLYVPRIVIPYLYHKIPMLKFVRDDEAIDLKIRMPKNILGINKNLFERISIKKKL